MVLGTRKPGGARMPKIQLTMEARLIPHGTVVTKQNGTKEYTLIKEGVKIYDNGKQVVLCAGVLLLQAESLECMNVIRDDTLLSLHYDTFDEAIGFLEELTAK